MLESKDKQIGSNTFRVTPLGAKQSLPLLLDLAKIVGPALGIVIDAAGAGSKSFSDLANTKITGDVFGRAAEMLFSRMDNGKVQELINKLMERTQIDREGSGNFMQLGPVYDLTFTGKLSELFGWLRFALEVNYSDFLPLLASLGHRASTVDAPAQAP